MIVDPMKLTSPTIEDNQFEEWLVLKNKLLMALDGQSISMRSLRYRLTEHLLTGDSKATFNQAGLDIGMCTVDNFNKVRLEVTKHAFPVYAFRQQKSYFCRHLVYPRRMKLLSFISRLQELNTYLK